MNVAELSRQARAAAVVLAQASRATKDEALEAMADAVAKAETEILDANAVDVDRAEADGTEPGPDRPAPARSRSAGRHGATDFATWPGCRTRSATWCAAGPTPTGCRCARSGCRSGSSGIIYEARPNVTADAAGICLKSGNAALLRGSSSAATSNARHRRGAADRLGGRRACPLTRSSWSRVRVR